MISSDIWSRSSRCLGTLVMLLLAVACTQQRETAEELVASHQSTKVQIDFSVPRFGKSRVGGTPSLKSVEGGDFENEATVKKIYLFYAPSTDPAAPLTRVVLDYSSSPVISGLFSTRLDLSEGAYDFYAVANPTASLEADLGTVTTRQALSDMVVTISKSEDELWAPFIMYGEAKSVTISATERVAMRLQRLVSQIEVVMSDKRFTIASAQLYNGAKSCYLSPHRDDVTGKSLTPDSGKRYNGVQGSLSNDSSVAHLFTLEYFSYDRTSDSEDTNPANDQSIYLILHLFKGKTDWGYFRIDPADYRGEQLISRNSLYTINIKEVRGEGYYKVEEAKANKATNLVLEYAQDADNFISKDVGDYRYVKFDGQYYLAMEDRDLQLVKDGRTDPFLLKTNAPNPEIQTRVVYVDPAVSDPLYEDWLTVEVSKDGNSGLPNGLNITRTALPDYANMEGVGKRSPVRKAIICVIVVGRPNLYTEIPVSQQPDDGYFDNLDADPSLHVSNGAQREVFYSTIATTFPDTYWYINKIYDSKGVDLLDPDLPEEDKWIHITLDTKPSYVDNDLGRPIYMGPSSLTIVADGLTEGSFYREGYIELKLSPYHRDYPTRSVTIRVVSGLGLDYRITYPDSEPKKPFMERSTRVIESSLYQRQSQTYSIDVSSTMKWEVKASHDWITITQPTFDKGSYNSTFTVTLPPNNQGEEIGGLYPAREGYVDIIGDQFFKRIMVYQGGYVRIGKEIWMDRNLKVSRFVGGSRNWNRYVIKTDRYNQELPPRDLLYACAVPIAQPGDEPVIYAYGRSFDKSPSEWGGSTTVPTSTYGRNKVEYFRWSVDPAQINSYGNNKTRYYFAGRNVPEANDGYFSWGMYGTFPAQTSNASRLNDAWNWSYYVGMATNVMQMPTSKSYNDPCPEGWRVPSYAELFRLNRYLSQARIYANGTEDYLPSEGLDAAAKDGMINNGVFFYNDDKVSCWFPFAGFRAMSTDAAFSIVSEGVKTAYWANFSSDGMNAFRATLEYQNAFIEYWNGNFSNPVRCIQNNTIE
ncbi:BACON domain-containing protein [uncultured Porphyromonas sp.]|uniref:BACON domain-containing protein n=1 Tax=uncultured Porphyromonas sp. TaxID=159274 RepID=UPI00261A672E|nr:BACON domain-containing carbohydrate-binding protein [uncultured Porphyromonas sp.]